MKKNSNPYSEPCNIKLVFSSDFSSFTIIHGKLMGFLKSQKDWTAIPEVPGTLKPSVTSNGLKPALYTVNIVFRVSYATAENQQELERWTRAKVIAQYTTGGGQQVVAGTFAHPLTFSFSQPEGFDGYECTLTGTQTQPACFI